MLTPVFNRHANRRVARRLLSPMQPWNQACRFEGIAKMKLQGSAASGRRQNLAISNPQICQNDSRSMALKLFTADFYPKSRLRTPRSCGLKLQFSEAGVKSTIARQRRVRALLDNPTLIHNQDAAAGQDRR